MSVVRADITRAMAILGGISGFPTEDIHQQLVRDCIGEMVGEAHELEWVTKVAYKTMRWWSLAEFRGIFCSRFKPADGIYAVAETPGLTPQEVEAAAEERYRQREAAEYENKLAEWKREAKLLGTKLQPFLLPPVTNTMEPKPGTTPAPEAPAVKDPLPEKKPALKELEAELAAQAGLARKRTPEEQALLLAEMERKLKGA